MCIMNEIHLEEPYLGSWGMRNLLKMVDIREYQVGRIQICTLMRKIGMEAIYKRPRLSEPHPGPVSILIFLFVTLK